jgi:hypothetical protein
VPSIKKLALISQSKPSASSKKKKGSNTAKNNLGSGLAITHFITQERVSSIKKLAKISPLIPSASKQKRREIVQRMPHLPTEGQTASSNIYQDIGL